MKVFISADIEGVAGISHWHEADHEHLRGEEVTFVRGWARSPMSMMETLDDSFDAVIFIGYHSAAYTPFSPLAHTMSSRKYQKICLNGVIASEFLINSYLSYYHGVPVVAISGDAGICQEAKQFDKRIATFATQHGIGDSTVSLHPEKCVKQIKAMVRAALVDVSQNLPVELPKQFEIQIEYKQIADYHFASFYPGVTKVDGRTLSFKSDDFYEIARALMFM